MGRLIDADLLIKDLLEQIPLAENVPIFREIIESQPTAYNVDKIVEQLEKIAPQWQMGERNPIDEAIEIVKVGGIDG